MSNNRFHNKVCIVTGAGSGIGRATAMQLAQEGGWVVVADIDEQGGTETLQQIEAQKGKALFMKCNVGSKEDIKGVVDKTVEAWSKIDVLVNNAAMMTFKKIVDLPVEEWEKLMQVNLRSVFLFTKYVIPYMDEGAIVNVSSIHAHETTRNVVPYAASKGAMEAFTRGVSQEYPSAKLRVNCVAPGAVDTPMLWSNPNVVSGAEKPAGAIATPAEIASAICFLASQEARFVNGATLVVDGGRLEKL